MKRKLTMAVAALSVVLLSGCATTIRSNVTTFHQWPAQMEDKSYVLEAPPPQDDTLELRSYQNLVRRQLAQLGFREAGNGRPNLLVSMRFMTTEVPVQVLQPAFSTFYSAPPLRMRYAGRRGAWGGGWYSPFYSPMWGSPMMYEAEIENRYRRELQVAIRSAADGRRLFDVTVHNVSTELSTPVVMPALVQSAFAGFPGPSGVARRVELQQVEPSRAAQPLR
ncbi:MAG TPA: DUF4136 domain-containing protein [Telluria sp.]